MTFPRFYEEINHLPHYIKIIFCVLVFLYPLKAQSTSHLREKTTFQELQTVHIMFTVWLYVSYLLKLLFMNLSYFPAVTLYSRTYWSLIPDRSCTNLWFCINNKSH